MSNEKIFVLVADCKPDEMHIFSRNITGCYVYVTPKSINDLFDERLTEDISVLSIFYYSSITKKVLNKFPKLKYIVTRSRGVNHIDMEECKKRKIKVLNLFYGADGVAEYTFALILSLAKRIIPSNRDLKRLWFEQKICCGLNGKTLGIIGTGKIGSQVAKFGRCFGMKLLAYDIVENVKLKKSYKVDYVSLDDLMMDSDFVTIHCWYDETTHHLINKDNLKLMKKTAYLINTSRGAIVDLKALHSALKNGKLAGAGLDVFEGEDYIRTKSYQNMTKKVSKSIALIISLLENPNVIMTPHNAFNTVGTVNRIRGLSLQHIKKCVDELSS